MGQLGWFYQAGAAVQKWVKTGVIYYLCGTCAWALGSAYYVPGHMYYFYNAWPTLVSTLSGL